MSQNICNICGANYEYRNGRWFCPACGAYKQEELSNEEVTLLYNAAQKLRMSDFDDAEKEYSDIIGKFPKNANGYWGRLLSKYGIKYEEDFDGRKIPTCYATSIESVINDKDYKKAIELADKETKEYYILQAQYIERVRKEWVEKARKEKPYDVFLCYKDSDMANGIDRTQDSIAVQDLYIHLTSQGYRVFFSRESLRDKVGEKYEPYIFNALSTAKVMLVYGSNPDYITSTWLKNEWTRYEKRIQAGEKKENSLLVACDGFSPNELPKVLAARQCFDATKRSFYGDLDDVIKKIIKGEEKPKPVVEKIEKKKQTKKMPIVLSLVVAVVAIFLGVLISNLNKDKPQGDVIASVTNTQFGASIVLTDDDVPKGTTFEIEEVNAGVQERYAINKLNINKENYHLYDMSLMYNGEYVSIDGNALVTLPIPSDISSDKAVVYYIWGDSSEKMSSTIADGKISFNTNHFSFYLIAEMITSGTPNDSNNDSSSSSSDDSSDDSSSSSPDDSSTPPTNEEVTITFAPNGGEGEEFTRTFDADSFDMPFNTFTKDGFTFAGWGIYPQGEVKYIEGGTYKIEDSITLYAIWQVNTNTIVFNANGGEGVMENFSLETNVGNMLPYNTFTRKGYTFIGWSEDSTSQTAEYEDHGFYMMGTSGTTLYAVWLANENEMVFNANGGSGIMQTQKIKTGSKEALNNCTFTRDGYSFIGWATTSDGEVVYSNQAQYTMGTESVYILYAVWDINKVALIYDANGGEGSMSSQLLEPNQEMSLNWNEYSKAGYGFKGWSLTPNGEVAYKNGANFTMGTTSITLYAVWEATDTSICLNPNGGKGVKTTVSAVTDETITLPLNDFTRDGYEFIGWATISYGEVKYLDGAEYTAGPDVSYNLYAIWSLITYTISYDLDGGKMEGETETYTIETTSFDLPIPEKAGYVFSGWSGTDINGVVKNITVHSGSFGNRSYKANWQVVNYTLTWHNTDDEQKTYTFNAEKDLLVQATYTPERVGYTFMGWSFENSDELFDYYLIDLRKEESFHDYDLYAHWDANTNTKYIVNHYYENANNNDFTLEQEELYGTTDTTVYPSVKTKDGFVSPSASSLKILGDGCAVVNYYYQRTTHQISFVSNGGNSVSSQTYKYGQSVSLPTCSRNGYTFGGWFTDADQTNSANDLIVTTNCTVYAWWQEENKANEFIYEGTDSITIKAYKGNATIIDIPDLIGGVIVEIISADAFGSGGSNYENTRLITSIKIPKGVSVIGERAFQGCVSLENIRLPEDIESIENVFAYCTSLEEISVPDSIMNMDSAFVGCTALKTVNIPKNIKKFSSTFYGCTSLEEISLTQNLKAIGGNAFWGSGLKTITLPENIVSIESNAFYDCYSLTDVYLTDKLVSVESTAFTNCTNLQNVYFGSLNKWCNIDFNGCFANPLYYADNLYCSEGDGSYTLINTLELCTVTKINPYVFSGYLGFINITIPSSITEIGANAFGCCHNLESVTINKNVEVIGEKAFDHCYNATIYCEVAAKPEGWDVKWNNETEVVWFYIGDIWDGTTTYSFAGGTGTEADPYQIATAEQLAYVATSVNQGVDTFNGKYIKLTTNIHLLNKEWTPIGSEAYAFHGIFDGGNNSIYALKITDNSLVYAGLFGKTTNATIKNLKIKEASIETTSVKYVGLVGGEIATISNVSADGVIKAYSIKYAGYVGGLVGRSTQISNCFANVSLYASLKDDQTAGTYPTIYAGGIAGSCSSIVNSFAEGYLDAGGGNLYHHDAYVGGIVGSGTEINNCYSNATVRATGKRNSYAGGIAGSATTISNCFSIGDVLTSTYSLNGTYGGSYIGRIIGKLDDIDTITNCYADSQQECSRVTSSSTKTGTTNTYGTLQFTQTLQSENFIYNILGWNSDIWQTNEGGFPTLK